MPKFYLHENLISSSFFPVASASLSVSVSALVLMLILSLFNPKIIISDLSLSTINYLRFYNDNQYPDTQDRLCRIMLALMVSCLGPLLSHTIRKDAVGNK